METLHPQSQELIAEFAKALAEKMREAEQKYGYRTNWALSDWEQDCRRQLLQHLDKGDPRDVAIYAAFMWWHGWSTSEPQAQADAA